MTYLHIKMKLAILRKLNWTNFIDDVVLKKIMVNSRLRFEKVILKLLNIL